MNIEFLTQDDPLYILPFFEEFFRNYASEFNITQVSCCRAMGKRSRWKLLKELACLYRPFGFLRLITGAAASRGLGLLPKGRGCLSYHSFGQLCRAYSVKCERVANPNAPEYVEELKTRKVDLLVSVACPYILKEHVLKSTLRGCINIHHAPLPHYKGMMPTFWQMYHGERKVGITIHYMAAKVDEGEALLQSELMIDPGESLHHLIRRSKRHGAHCMAKVLHEIASNNQVPVKLDNDKGSYFTFPTFEEMRTFHRRGLRAI
jgi:methionyl-tRNA formyltransferase